MMKNNVLLSDILICIAFGKITFFYFKTLIKKCSDKKINIF